MKIAKMFTAALLAATVLSGALPASASAQDRGWRTDRAEQRGDARGDRQDRGRADRPDRVRVSQSDNRPRGQQPGEFRRGPDAPRMTQRRDDRRDGDVRRQYSGPRSQNPPARIVNNDRRDRYRGNSDYRRDNRADYYDGRRDDRARGDDRRRGYVDNRSYNRGGDYRWTGGGGNWDRRWREDRRYDWRGYRNGNRGIYSLPRYYGARGASYRQWSPGYRLDPYYYGSSFWISDPWRYRLPPVYGYNRWVRYYDDVMLVDTRSGYISDVELNFFF